MIHFHKVNLTKIKSKIMTNNYFKMVSSDQHNDIEKRKTVNVDYKVKKNKWLWE